VTNLLARAIKYAPIFAIPGTGKQVVQPVAVDDLAACVAMASMGRGRNATFAIGGPEPMNFDELIRLMMDLSGHHRPIVHVPQALMRIAGRLGEMLPQPVFSRDAVDFLVADNPCDNGPLIAEFGIRLTSARLGMSYLKPKA